MAAARPQRAKIKPKEEASYFSSLCKDKNGFEVKYINSYKGELPKFVLCICLGIFTTGLFLIIVLIKSLFLTLPLFFVRSRSVQLLPLSKRRLPG